MNNSQGEKLLNKTMFEGVFSASTNKVACLRTGEQALHNGQCPGFTIKDVLQLHNTSPRLLKTKLDALAQYGKGNALQNQDKNITHSETELVATPWTSW